MPDDISTGGFGKLLSENTPEAIVKILFQYAQPLWSIRITPSFHPRDSPGRPCINECVLVNFHEISCILKSIF